VSKPVPLFAQVYEYLLPRTQQAVLLAFAEHAKDERPIWPGIGRIAWMTGLDRRTVALATQALVQRGALIVVRPATWHYPAHYRIALSALQKKPPYESATKRRATTAPQTIATEPIVAMTVTVTGDTRATGAITNVEPDKPNAASARTTFRNCACGHGIASPIHRDGVCQMTGCGCGLVTADDLAALTTAIPEDLRAWAAQTSGFWL